MQKGLTGKIEEINSAQRDIVSLTDTFIIQSEIALATLEQAKQDLITLLKEWGYTEADIQKAMRR